MKKFLYAFISIFTALISLLFLDFSLGKKKHKQHAQMRKYPERNSHLLILTDGKRLYADLFNEIRQAQYHIHVLFFIISNDKISQQFLNLLKQKAMEGVTVRLLLDRLGGLKLKNKDIERLNAAGVHFSYSQTPGFPYYFHSIMARNHRKIVIIDGSIAYIGGFNIGKKYIDGDPSLTPWRDYNIKFTGMGVLDLQREFFRDWTRATKRAIQANTQYFPLLEHGPTQHQLLATDGNGLEDELSSLINKAKQSLLIGTPYFIPTPKLLQVLKDALHRGVELSIIVPDLSDHPLVKEAGLHYLRKLALLGAKVYQYQNGFYHTKLLIADEKVCDLGTANFDKRSMNLNSEINCLIEDPATLQVILDKTQEDLLNSTLLSTEDLMTTNPLKKAKEWIAVALSDLL